MRTSIFLVIAILFTCQNSALAETTDNAITRDSLNEQTTLKPYNEEKETGKGMENGMPMGDMKGKGNGLEKMYMIFMMCKTLISTLLMFVSPIMQVKSFGLMLIGTILNIARFVYQLKNNKAPASGASPSMAPSGWASGLHLSDDPWSNGDRVGIAYNPSFRPAYFTHYPNYVHKYHIKS